MPDTKQSAAAGAVRPGVCYFPSSVFHHILVILALAARSAARIHSGYYGCPAETTFAVGSFTTSPYRSDFAGVGLTLVRQRGRNVTDAVVMTPRLVGDNPTYVAAGRDALFVASSVPTGAISRISLHPRAPFVTNSTVYLPAQLTTHVSLTQNERVVLSANVFGGTVSALLVKRRSNQLVLRSTFVIEPSLATNASRRQRTPQPHMVLPYGRGVIVPDLGSDRVFYLSVGRHGRLRELQNIRLSAEDGPRHAVAHPPTSTLYIVNELSQTVSTLCADGYARMPLRECQRHILLREGRVENGTAAAIRISNDARFLYISVRRDSPFTPLYGRIVAFALAPSGRIVRKIGQWSSGGAHPRDFFIADNLRVDGVCRSYIVVANRDSNNLLFIRRSPISGRLGSIDLTHEIKTPASVLPL